MKAMVCGAAASLCLLLALALNAFAADEPASEGAPSPADAATSAPEAKRELTPQEEAEKTARRECEAKICDIISTRDPVGGVVTCDIVKTWREEDMVKALGGRINWPWGSAMCESKVTLARAPLAKAMSEASYAMTMPTQTASCSLAQAEGDPYVIELSVAPTVKFENGKATEAQINWGKASAPMMIYPLIYAGTALDNSTNVLGPELARLVNKFVSKKCTEVRADLPRVTPD